MSYQKISEILSGSFVFAGEMARILSLAFASKKFVIVFGPGGHAKSEMVKAVIDGLGLDNETFYQFFGEGMDESRLFGGLNFRKLEDEKVLEYYPEKSFLNSRIAVFEELFDAPASVLLALKDVLTSKELRNGAQRFKMRTEVIICLTNKEPGEISDLGPASHALVERFPLQLNLAWADYSAKSYLQLLEKVAPRLGGPVMNGFKGVLAEILANATATGNFVSPRTAVHAFQVCQTAASMRGSDHVEKQDLTDLRFLPGLEGLAETIQKDLDVAMERAAAENRVMTAERKLGDLLTSFEDAKRTASPIKLLQVAKALQTFGDEASSLKVTDGLTDRRKRIRDTVAEKAGEAQKLALENTRV
ncbi:MAG: AAA family ATPase [Patescibacteria group bacterium]|jgi:MoxR-like ATPase